MSVTFLNYHSRFVDVDCVKYILKLNYDSFCSRYIQVNHRMFKLAFICLLIVQQLSCHDHHGHGHDHHGHGHDHHGHDHDHHGHGHDHHGHSHGEEPKFKYTRQANTKVEDEGPDFPAEAHGHAHDTHGHTHGADSHGAHGHTHGGDSHGAHGHAHGGDSHGAHGHAHGSSKTFNPPVKKTVNWFEPLLATAIISAAPFLILFVVPLTNNSPENQPFLKILLAFASGGLLGDAFLHLIPHAISPHSHDGDSHSHSHSHSHGGGDEKGHDHTGDMIIGLWVLGGIIAFLVVEKMVRHIKGGHGHSHGPPAKKAKESDDEEETKKKDKKDKKEKADNKEGNVVY